MKRLALFLLLSCPAWADVSPPPSARLVGSDPALTLRWDGTAKQYFLQVLIADKVFFEGNVQGNSKVLEIKPNCLYTWKVSPATATGFRDTGETYTFQHSSRMEYHYDAPPSVTRRLVNGPTYGAPGADGKPGGTVTVDSAVAGDFYDTTIQGPRETVKFLLMPNSAPLLITARGGDGGDGTPGAPGAAGYVNPDGGYMPAGNGGTGGRGGNGGDGGRITVRANYPQAEAMFRFDVPPGLPGRGGPGGEGGYVNQGYNNQGSNNPAYNNPGYYQPASSGLQGPDGRPGRPGQIIR